MTRLINREREREQMCLVNRPVRWREERRRKKNTGGTGDGRERESEISPHTSRMANQVTWRGAFDSIAEFINVGLNIIFFTLLQFFKAVKQLIIALQIRERERVKRERSLERVCLGRKEKADTQHSLVNARGERTSAKSVCERKSVRSVVHWALNLQDGQMDEWREEEAEEKRERRDKLFIVRDALDHLAHLQGPVAG